MLINGQKTYLSPVHQSKLRKYIARTLTKIKEARNKTKRYEQAFKPLKERYQILKRKGGANNIPIT